MKHNIWNLCRVYVPLRIADIRIVWIIESGGRHIIPWRWIRVSLHNGTAVLLFIVRDQSPPVSGMPRVRQRLESESIDRVIGPEGPVSVYGKTRLIENAQGTIRSRPDIDTMCLQE